MRSANSQTHSFLTKQFERPLARLLGTIHYETLPRQRDIPPGVVIFTEIEAMTEAQRALAVQAADQLQANGVKVLNHPARALPRLALLEKFHAEGPNSFRAFRSHSVPDDVRLPVFLRLENDHEGPRTPLIEDRDDLRQVLLEGYAKGFDPHQLLVVEYLDTRGPDGLFRKYGAFRIGDRIVARHLVISRDWMVKVGSRLMDPATLDEEHAYMAENPHAKQLRELFDLAGLEYGRIDYSIHNGKIETWEINSNPVSLSPAEHYSAVQMPHHQACAARLREAFEALNEHPQPGPTVLEFHLPRFGG